MTRTEAMKIVMILETNWQQVRDQEAAYDLWASAFVDDSFELVYTAVMDLVQTSTDEFRPTIGKVRRKINDLIRGRKLTETEAWLKVREALHEAQSNPETLGGAKSAWKNLPQNIQKLVTPRQLLDWNNIDTEQLDTVVQSNFMRSYRDVITREYENETRPHTHMQRVKAIQGASDVYSDPDALPEATEEKPKTLPKPGFTYDKNGKRVVNIGFEPEPYMMPTINGLMAEGLSDIEIRKQIMAIWG